MAAPTASAAAINAHQTPTLTLTTVDPASGLSSSPSPSPPSSPSLRLSSLYTSISTAISTSRSNILKITLPSLTFGGSSPSTPLTPFSATSPRYTDPTVSQQYSDSTLISPPYSPVSPHHDYLTSYDDERYTQSPYAAMWSRRLHVLSRYVAYYARTYYVLALLSSLSLTLLYTSAAVLLHMESPYEPEGPIGLDIDMIYCTLLALLSVPIVGCVSFLTRRSNKPNILHWTTQTDFHMISGLCLSVCSFALYALTTLPSSPLSSICSSIIDIDTVNWICLISCLTQGFGVLTGGLFLLSTLTSYFNSVRFINSLPLEIIQDPESPGFWRGVNVGDVDWEEESFVML